MSKRASIGLSKPDLQFTNCGTFAACRPETAKGREWLSVHTGYGPMYTNDDGVLVIEFRYLEDIVNGARADGLICEG